MRSTAPARPLHRLPYIKTDCSGTFEVSNNSLSNARLKLSQKSLPEEVIETDAGAVLEMTGLLTATI